MGDLSMPKKRTAGRVEKIKKFGLTWFRYPDAKQVSDRRYFRHGGMYLHRFVWEAVHGEIPDGYHIHHKDEDPGNNEIENLELLPAAEHLRGHHAGKSTPAKRANLDRIRALTKAWHASEEGREWHRQHASQALQNREPTERTCEQCGGKYTVQWNRKIDRFCSNRCKVAARYASGVDDVTRTCPVCGTEFRINKYTKTKSCSRSCAQRMRNGARGSVQSDGERSP